MSMASPNLKTIPVNVVGSTKFGRYAKISNEITYNQIISDGWLVPFAGYEAALQIQDVGKGRGIYSSTKLDKMVVVIDNEVYLVGAQLTLTKIGNLITFTGDVQITENNTDQIALCDHKKIYIYNYKTNVFTTVNTDFIPNSLEFQNGYFISASSGEAQYRLSALGDGTSWPADAQHVGTFQTKPDTCVSCVKIPGKGNLLFVIGNTVIEPWVDVGTTLFPYQKNTAFDIDYGCANIATIASSDNFIAWLGKNEKSGYAIMVSDGGQAQVLSNDGINFQLANITNAEQSAAYFFRQDGHLFYVISFYDPQDNFTLAYDFTTKALFNLTDPKYNHHIAKKVTFFNDEYYFISFVDGNLYRMNSEIETYDGEEIPRIRIMPTIRLPDGSGFVANSFSFILEQGQDNNLDTTTDIKLRRTYTASVDLSVSRDGGVTFGNASRQDLNAHGKRINKVVFWNLGFANEMTLQLRFWGKGRFVANNGLLSIYK